MPLKWTVWPSLGAAGSHWMISSSTAGRITGQHAVRMEMGPAATSACCAHGNGTCGHVSMPCTWIGTHRKHYSWISARQAAAVVLPVLSFSLFCGWHWLGAKEAPSPFLRVPASWAPVHFTPQGIMRMMQALDLGGVNSPCPALSWLDHTRRHAGRALLACALLAPSCRGHLMHLHTGLISWSSAWSGGILRPPPRTRSPPTPLMHLTPSLFSPRPTSSLRATSLSLGPAPSKVSVCMCACMCISVYVCTRQSV